MAVISSLVGAGDWLVVLTKREKYILSEVLVRAMTDCCVEHEINKYEREKRIQDVTSVIQERSRSFFIYGTEKVKIMF